jgi:tetratricopeptide (TPR) repeat protein
VFATAVALLERQEWNQAVEALERVLAMDPAFAEGWLELGNAQMQRARFADAIAAYGQALAIDSTLCDAHANLALAHQEQGHPEAAIAAWRDCLAMDPNDGEALRELGGLLQAQEDWDGAFEAFQRAQALDPSPDLLTTLADLRLRQDDPQGAVTLYRQALRALPTPQNGTPTTSTAGDGDLHAQIHARLGVALHQLGQLEEAIASYGQALQRQPGLEQINGHRDTALEQLKGAVLSARQGLRERLSADGPSPDGSAGTTANPSRLDRLAAIAVTLHRVGCLEDAIAAYGQALALQPEQEELQALHAKALEQRQDPALLADIAGRLNLLALYDDQLAALERAAALAPSNAEIQLDLALALLRFGQFERGWPLYEWRRQPTRPEGALPPWQPGQACERLLIVPPRDLGDQVMFASLLPDAAALTPAQVLRIDPRLRPLLARSCPHLQLLSPGQPIDPAQPCQAQIPMGSLAAHLRPSRAHFLASRRAYLQADPATTQALRRRHHPNATCATGELLVGLCWRSTSAANGGMKSIPLATLAGALALPGVRLLSLQYGNTRAERDDLRRATGLEVHADPTIDTFADIDNLAALIAACDLVVSVSNTTAHLAGALGQRTCLLVDSRLDWRWGLDDSETLWYPRTRLFRQPAAGDWATPLAAIQGELERLRREGLGGKPPQLRGLVQLSQGSVAGAGAGRTPPPGKWVF